MAEEEGTAEGGKREGGREGVDRQEKYQGWSKRREGKRHKKGSEEGRSECLSS